MYNDLRELCLLSGISGEENEIREYIISRIREHCDYKVDALGNIIAQKIGKKRPKRQLMISAHMDEVGMIVTSIKEDGTLLFSEVGGVDARVILGRSVLVGPRKIPGVIGTKAVHMQTSEERNTAVPVDQLYIDIGAEKKEEALLDVSLGDAVSFAPCFGELGNGYLYGKALDDRIGCAMLIQLIREELEYDCTFVFCTQEEVGLRGSRTAAYAVAPEVAIVLEATTAGDLPGVPEAKKVCQLGKGPVVSFMDRATIYDKELYRTAFGIAKEAGIPCQTKTMIAGGNDAGAIHTAANGVRTLAVSAPCRYIHSPSGVVNKSDLDAMYDLTKRLAERFAAL